MLNSRKLFKALAVTGLLTLGSVASYAQGNCTTLGTSGSKALRPESLTELVGTIDIGGCAGLPATYTVNVTFPTAFAIANIDPNNPIVTGAPAGTPTYPTANSVSIPITAAAAGFSIDNIRLNVAGSGSAAGATVVPTVVIYAGTNIISFSTPITVGQVLPSSLNFSLIGGTSATASASAASLAACINYPIAGGSGSQVAGFLKVVETSPAVLRNAGTEGGVATQIHFAIGNVPAGVTVYVPNGLFDGGTTTIQPIASGSGISTTATYGPGGTAVDPYTGTAPVYAGNYGAVTGSDIYYTVVATNELVGDTLAIPFIVKFTGGPAVGIGTATAKATLAPLTAGIPRFNGDGPSVSFFSTTVCSTTLLYPYVTTDAGFDTGVAITNTTSDTFGTAAQAGTCSINAFGAFASGATVPAAGTSPSVASGRTWAFSLTDSAVFASGAKLGSGFNGYLIAQCNFQLAHGYAFISTYGLSGANSVAQGYLALVVPGSSAGRASLGALGAESLGN